MKVSFGKITIKTSGEGMELGKALKEGIEKHPEYSNVKITGVDQFESRNRNNTEQKGHLNYVINGETKQQTNDIMHAISELKSFAYPKGKFSVENSSSQVGNWESPEQIIDVIL
jgi:hypothetical protein